MKKSLKILNLLLLLTTMPLFGQESPKDSIAVKNNIPKIGLKKPESIVHKYTYNPQLNKYVYTQKLGEYDLSTPMFLSVKEYEDLVLRERMRTYYKEKWDAVDDSKSDENKKNVQRDLLPDLYVNSDFFESIFGGRNIDIIPQGNVGIDLGVRYTKTITPP